MTQPPGPQRLSAALSELITLRGLARARSNGQLEDIWKRVVDPNWGERTRVMGIRRGVLQVAVDSAPLRSELETYHKADLLRAIQDIAPHLNLRNLKFVLQRTVPSA